VDDVRQSPERRADDSAHAPRGGQSSWFFVERRAAASGTVVRGGGLSVFGRGEKSRSAEKIPCKTRERARETSDRRLSRRGTEEAGFLRADAARGRQPGAAPAER